METFQEWVGKKQPEKEFDVGYGKEMPNKKNQGGGFDPQTPQQLKVFKKIDLITLPVEGTNCGNCMFIKTTGNGVGFCSHKDVKEWVTSKMCCALWSNEKVKRQWDV